MSESDPGILVTHDDLERWKARFLELNEIMRAAQRESRLLQRKISAAEFLLNGGEFGKKE